MHSNSPKVQDRNLILSQLTPEQQEQFNKAFPIGKKKKQSPANELTTAIIKYVFSIGGAARRINNGAVYDPGKEIFRQGTKRGTEDIICTIPIVVSGKKIGLHVGVEVKIGKDRQSDYQKEREQEIRKAGGVYLIAKTFDQIRVEIDKIRSYYS